MQLNTVVLPAPFGPISAVISPCRASNERSSTATSPPKRMVRCSTRSNVSPVSAMAFLDQVDGDALALLQEHRRLARGDEATRLPDHDQYHGEAEQHHAVLRRIEGGPEDLLEEIEFAHNFGAADHDDGGNRHADLAAHAAEHDDGQDRRRLQEGEALRRDETLARGEERAGE